MRKSLEIIYWTAVGVCFLSGIAGKALKETSSEFDISIDPLVTDSMQYGGGFTALALLFIRGIGILKEKQACIYIGNHRNSFHKEGNPANAGTPLLSDPNLSTYNTTPNV